MTKRTRTTLFFICFFLFLLSAFSAVFYSQGYRIDTEKKKITQTGAFYFKVLPKSVQIYLTPSGKHLIKEDRKLKKKTDFFFGSVLIENLLPGIYTVQIKKEGYLAWEKTLEIKEKQVTEAKNVVLIPEKPAFNILTKEVKNFFFSPDQKKIILEELSENNWQLKLYNLRSGLKSHLIEAKDVSKEAVDFRDLKFSPDSKRILLKVALKKGLKYLLLDLDKGPSPLISLDFLETDFEDVFFNPEDSQKLFLFKKGVFFEGDLIKKEVSLPLLENVVSYQIFNKSIYYLDNFGFLFKTDFSFVPRERINRTPFLFEKEVEQKLNIFPDFILLEENQNLYLFNPDSGAFEKFFEKVKELKISPDLKKIVYFSDFEIWILFLKPQLGQPQKSAGEQMFLTRFSERIDQVFWFSSHYLILNIGNKIKIAEIDDRDRINIVDLAEFEKPNIFWNQNYKELYILSNENLIPSDSEESRFLPKAGFLYKSEKLIK